MIKIELEGLLDGRTLYWLSQETGIRWGTLAAMAKGKMRRLDLESLDLICATLGCQPGDLLVREERRKKKRAR
ncbi:MAG: helix-turn-helix domain-containing protein [Pyrinomonadaceae bacterium]